MNKIIKTIYSFWSTSIAIEMEYRFNIIIEILSLSGNLIGSLFTLSLFYGPNTNLGGWSWPSSLVVLGIYTILDGFTISILQPNLSRIVRHVQNGTLDFVLLKPIYSQLWVSLRLFSPWGIPSVFVGMILILFGIYYNNLIINFQTIICFLTMLFSSLLILYSLWFLIASTSIWFVKVWNANEVLRSTLVAGRYPIYSYPSLLRRLFTFILPIAFLTTVPAEALLNISSPSWITASVFVSFSFLNITIWFWRYALRFYTSASS